MIEHLLACILIADMNPADPSGLTMYPSGVMDRDRFVFSAPPATKLPLLRLGTSIIDSDGQTVESDMYQVKVSEEKDYIFFIRNNQPVARFKIESYVGYSSEFLIPLAQIILQPNKRVLLKVREGNFEFISNSIRE